MKTEEYSNEFEYLDTLRESGSINMFEAPSYLIDYFDITKKEAVKILQLWMKQYGR